MKAKSLMPRVSIVLSLLGAILLFYAPAAEAAPPQQGQVTYHTVKRGENLAWIAARYGTTIGAIMQRNNIRNPNIIYAGQALAIPISAPAASNPSPSVTFSASPTGSCAAGCTYRIVWGDTLASIAARFGTTAQYLMSANGLHSSYIMAGATLRVPCTARQASVSQPPTRVKKSVAAKTNRVSYRVRPGDTLSSIALLYHTTVRAIMAANGLTNPHHIYAGQVLRIPLR